MKSGLLSKTKRRIGIKHSDRCPKKRANERNLASYEMKPLTLPTNRIEGEALRRYPGTGQHDGHPCTCTRDCPAVCDGDQCGCQACLCAWIDAGLDKIIGTNWATAHSLGRDSDPVQ